MYNYQKFVTNIFKVKIGLSPALMNDNFKSNKKPYSQRVNSQFKPEDPSNKILHRNINKYGIESFSK